MDPILVSKMCPLLCRTKEVCPNIVCPCGFCVRVYGGGFFVVVALLFLLGERTCFMIIYDISTIMHSC